LLVAAAVAVVVVDDDDEDDDEDGSGGGGLSNVDGVQLQTRGHVGKNFLCTSMGLCPGFQPYN
jgi:hypothetical protein